MDNAQKFFEGMGALSLIDMLLSDKNLVTMLSQTKQENDTQRITVREAIEKLRQAVKDAYPPESEETTPEQKVKQFRFEMNAQEVAKGINAIAETFDSIEMPPLEGAFALLCMAKTCAQNIGKDSKEEFDSLIACALELNRRIEANGRKIDQSIFDSLQ